MPTKSIPYVLLLGTIWGTNLVFSRFGVGQFDAFLFVGLRLCIATLAFVVVFSFSNGKGWSRDRHLWKHAGILGILGTAIPMSGLIGSLQFQSSGVTSVLVTTAPAITAVLAHFLLPDEKLNRYKIFGVGLALAGAVLLIALGETGLPNMTEANPLGYIMVFASLVFATLGAIYIRTFMKEMDTAQVTSVRLLAASIVVLPIALLWRGADFSMVTWQGVASLFYAGLVGAFVAQMLGMDHYQQIWGNPVCSGVVCDACYVGIVRGVGLGRGGDKWHVGRGGVDFCRHYRLKPLRLNNLRSLGIFGIDHIYKEMKSNRKSPTLL